MYRKSEHIDGEITLREMLFSVFIVGVLFFFGCIIHNKISSAVSDHNKKIEQAIRFSNDEMFNHCLATSPGDAFCEGDLNAVNPVSDWDAYVSGEYFAIRRRYQIYTMHTRVVHYTTGSGKNVRHHTRTEHYWTWDTHNTEIKMCDNIMFCGIKFERDKISGYKNWENAGTFSIGHNRRYVYETIKKHHHGTLRTTFKDKTITTGSGFYDGAKPEEVAAWALVGVWPIILFWCIAVIVICGIVFLFCMINNRWLESIGKKKVIIDVGTV